MPNKSHFQRVGNAITERASAVGSWLRAHPALVVFCLAVGLYYFWTIQSSGLARGSADGDPLLGLGENRTDYYNQLSDGFLAGHLHLLAAPSRHLLSLANPYDPAANLDFRANDLSLYGGHYYMYWGPAPALVAFMPFRILGLGDLQPAIAGFLFAFVGFCFSLAALRELAARFAPQAPRWMLGAAGLALAFGNALPFTLRRLSVYEIAITAAFCFCFIALYLAITALRDGAVSRNRLAASSLFIGLAVGSRPTMVIPALALLGLAIWLWRRTPDRAQGARILAAALGPLAAIGALLVAYNVARFGSPLEFGQSYQLAAVDPSTMLTNQPSYVPPGLWYYLFSPPHLTWGFPFVYISPMVESYPLTAPSAYKGLEPVAGLLLVVPFSLAAFIGLFVTRGTTRRVVAILCAIALTMIFLTSLALWGATMRYEVDFASFLLIAAALSWLVWVQGLGSRARAVVTAAGVVLIACSVVFGVAIGMTGYYDSLRTASPGTYKALQRYTSVVPTMASRIKDQPLALAVYQKGEPVADSDPGRGVGLVDFPLKPGASADMTVASGSERRYGLALSGLALPRTTGDVTIVIQVRQTGSTQRIEGSSFPRTVVPIRLKRGLNHIVISATGPRHSGTKVAGVGLVELQQ